MYTNRAHCRALRLMFALRKEQAYFINLNGICLRLRLEGVQGASGKPPASGMIRQLCRNQFPVGGRVGFDIPWVSRQLRCPKVSKGRAEGSSVRPQAYPPCRGIDAPTTAREWDLASHGALTLFFRWRKKSVQKKASGTATPEAARPASRYSQISAFRALPCPALVFAQACQSLTAYGSCAHWARAPSRPKLRPAVAERLDDPNKFGSSNSGLRAGTV